MFTQGVATLPGYDGAPGGSNQAGLAPAGVLPPFARWRRVTLPGMGTMR